MANVRGGSMAGRHIVGSAKYFPEAPKPDGTGTRAAFYMVDAQLHLDKKAPENVPQTNPHLHSHLYTTPDGQKRTAHGLVMSVSQVEEIRKGSKVANVDGENFEFGCIADLGKAKDGGLVIKPGTVKKTDIAFGKNTLENQAKVVAKLKEEAAKTRAADKQADAAEAQAPEAEAEAALG